MQPFVENNKEEEEEDDDDEDEEEEEDEEEDDDEGLSYTQEDINKWCAVKGGLSLADLRKKAAELGFEGVESKSKVQIKKILQDYLDEN